MYRGSKWDWALAAKLPWAIGLGMAFGVGEVLAGAAGVLPASNPGTSATPRPFIEYAGAKAVASAGLSNRQAAVRAGELLLRFRPSVGPIRQRAILASLPGNVERFAASKVRARIRLLNRGASGISVFDQFALVRLNSPRDLAAGLAHFRAQPEVLYAEPNYQVRIADRAPPLVPNDFYFGQQWDLQGSPEPGSSNQWGIQASQAWAWSTGDLATVVAVIDTGIDYYHPDLAPNIWTNGGELAGNGLDDDGNGFADDVHGYDFVSDDSDPMDDNGHGTHVAGTIGALGNNGQGIAGICWRVSLMAVKCFDENGSADVASVLKGVAYAIGNGARIINASWEEPEYSQALRDGVEEAHRAGLVVVAAAGNQNSDDPIYPAAYSNVVSVAATTSSGQRARYSNFGPLVTLAAPGDDILSTLPDNNYGVDSGTSMAAAHASGVAALVLSRHPEFSNTEVEDILRHSTVPIQTDLTLGTGLLDASAAARIDSPLPEAHLTLPNPLFGVLDITGTAGGRSFAGYQIDFGAGSQPTNWTVISTGSSPVTNGVLCQAFDASNLPDGPYLFRLTSHGRAGDDVSDHVLVNVSNVHVASPLHEDIVRAGELMRIQGTVVGRARTYRIEHGMGFSPTNWSNAGVKLMNEGTRPVAEGTLATWDTSAVEGNQFYTLRLTATADDGSQEQALVHLVYLDSHLKPGWPQYLPVTGPFPAEDWRDVVVADLDGDGRPELILVDHGSSAGTPAQLLVYGKGGQLRWSRALGPGPPYSDIPVVGDIDGDGFPEILVDAGNQGQLFAFRHDGTALAGHWPVPLQATSLGKVIADLRGDGQRELIGLSQNPVMEGTGAFRQLVVYDRHGTLLQKWDVPWCASDPDPHMILPAVGNLDGQPGLEIVAVTGCNSLSAFKLGQGSPLWTASVAGTLVASPAIGDLNQDGSNEVVLGVVATDGLQSGGVYAFDNQGALLPNWPALLGESFSVPAALADFNGDGSMEIAIPSWTSGRVHLLRADGFEADGWPVGPLPNSSAHSAAVAGDVDGDGKPDLVMAAPGDMAAVVNSGDFSGVGGVRAWRFDGQPINLSGGRVTPALAMESSDGPWLKAPAVSLVPMGLPGRLGIVAASVQDRTYLPVGEASAFKNRSSIYFWELGVPATPSALPWPMFQANPQHTGLYPGISSNKAAALPRVAAARDGQPALVLGTNGLTANPIRVVTDENTPVEINVATNPDVAGGAAALVSLSQPQHGSIWRKGTNLIEYVPATDYSGMDSVSYVIGDELGATAQGNISVLVRFVPQPPVAQDQRFTLNRNASQNIVFNATDPNNDPLTYTIVAGPGHGTVLEYPTVCTYTPAKGFFGLDRFTYRAADGFMEGPAATVQLSVLNRNNPPVVQSETVLTRPGRPVQIHVAASDLDDDPLTFQIVSSPAHGSVQGTGTNYVYQSAAGFLGSDRFTLHASDGQDWSPLATITINVTTTNSAPVAQDALFDATMNLPTNVTVQATDAESDPLTYQIVAAPVNGSLSGIPPHFQYTPGRNYFGPDRFTFLANDGKLNSNIGTVTITVHSLNHVPLATNQVVLVSENTPTAVQLNVSDSDGQALDGVILKGPQHGQVYGSGTRYVYTPATDYQGNDSFSYEAWDGQAYSDAATVTLQISGSTRNPPLAFAVVTLTPNGQVQLSLSGVAGRSFQILASTNLVDWVPIANLLARHDTISVTDTNAPRHDACYYRALQF
jgi:subtilisin family serine protease